MKILIIQAICLFVVMASFGQTVFASIRDNTVVHGRAADSTFLDPAMFLDNESAMVIENIFDGLVRYEDDSTLIEPALASSWEPSESGRVWTFTLRKNVIFHDGSRFDASAVVFSLLRKIDPRHPYYREEFAKMDQTLKIIESVEAIGDYTVKISLKEPYAPFLNVLATHSSYIVSPTAVMKWGGDFSKHPVGTGPFVFEEWIPKEKISLKANGGYWKGSPYIERVVFKIIPDNRMRLLELNAASIDTMDGINPSDVGEIGKRPSLSVTTRPGLNVGYLALNLDKPPFNERKVRLAISHAINKASLVKFLFQGMAIPAKTSIPPTMWSHNDGITDYEYDPAKAKQLLQEAGYPQGFETTLWAMPVPRPYMPEPEKIAEAIQANLAAVGIRAKIISWDWKTYLAKLYNGEHDMGLLGWVGTGDPSDFLHHLFDKDCAVKPHATNISFFKEERVHELIRIAQQSTDMSKRLECYREIQQIVHNQAPLIPLAHANQVLVHNSRVQGVVQHQTGVIRFHKAKFM